MTNEGVFRRLRGALLCAAALGVAAAAACAGLSTANKRSPGQVVNGQFKPALPPAPSYGADPKLTCPDRGVNGALKELLDKEDLKGKKMIQDGRLCAVAETMLGWTPAAENEPVPESLRSFLSQYFGLPSTLSGGAFIVSELDTSDKPVDVATPMVAPLVNFAENAKSPRWGVAAERGATTSGGARSGSSASTAKYKIRLVMYDEAVVLEPPLPRSLPPNGNATLSGHVEGDYKNVKVNVSDAVGKLTTKAVEGKTFNVPLTCGERQGKLLVQLAGESDTGDVRLASMPVLCGGQLATQAPVQAGPSGPVDPAAAEKQIAEQINSERAGANLKPLNVSAPLSEVARAMSERQSQGKPMGGGELQQMITDKEIRAPSINANAASAFSAEEAYGRLSDSAADRANQMSPDVTDLGIGVVKGNEVGGKPTIVVSVLYIKSLPPPDPEAAKTKLYEAIAKKREGAGLEPLKKDETLESVAQKYADAAAKIPTGQVPRDEESTIMAPLYKSSMVVNQMGNWMPDEVNALQFAEQGSIISKSKLVGVGIAMGKSERFGKNSLFIMVLVGTKTDAKAPAKKAAPAPKKKKK